MSNSFDEIIQLSNNLGSSRIYCYDINYKGQHIYEFGKTQKEGMNNLIKEIFRLTGDTVKLDTWIGPSTPLKNSKVLYFNCHLIG